MIIDTHIHESKYSSDSHISFDELIQYAKDIGLEGICITNHDNNTLADEIGESLWIDGLLVIVGAEMLTKEGDILVFGVKDLPKEIVPAEDLLRLVRASGGVAIAAHPYRNNNRGLGDNLRRLHGLLDGVEAFNGSTLPHHNLTSYAASAELNLPSFGASDAHVLKKLGCYATNFAATVRDHIDFIEAVRSVELNPVMKMGQDYINLDYLSLFQRYPEAIAAKA